MPRYLDAEILESKIDEMQDELLTNNDELWDINKPYYKGLAIARGFLNDTPTADVVEVVRCKDCKYWDAVRNPKYKDTGICVPPRKDLGGYCVRRGATNCNDFCSQGERVTNDAELH